MKGGGWIDPNPTKSVHLDAEHRACSGARPRNRLTADRQFLEDRAGVAGIAQLVEHNLAKVGVASSNLVSRSKFLID